jgi:hypothetical protein
MKALLPTLIIALLLLTGCDRGPKSAMGFRLPDGDAAAGQEIFVALECDACHTVKTVTLPPVSGEAPVRVELGGEVGFVKTYGELVTSIINPSHKLAPGYPSDEISYNGESRMKNYNDVMTVKELIDLVAFLQSKYQVKVPKYHYRIYGPL